MFLQNGRGTTLGLSSSCLVRPTHRFVLVPAASRNVATHHPGILSITNQLVTRKPERVLPNRTSEIVPSYFCQGGACLHTLLSAGVMRRAGPQRNCLSIFQVFLSLTNLFHTNTICRYSRLKARHFTLRPRRSLTFKRSLIQEPEGASQITAACSPRQLLKHHL